MSRASTIKRKLTLSTSLSSDSLDDTWQRLKCEAEILEVRSEEDRCLG